MNEDLDEKEEAWQDSLKRERRCAFLEMFVEKLRKDLQENLMRNWADEDVRKVDGILSLSQTILYEINKLERRL